jgi:superfamily I DNA and/or RNA helicase
MDKLTTFDKSKQKSNFFGKVYSLYRQALKKVIEEADILITTTVLSYRIHEKVGNVITRGKYNERPYCPDVVILDEASQATWADTLCFLSFNAGRMVLVGD